MGLGQGIAVEDLHTYALKGLLQVPSQPRVPQVHLREDHRALPPEIFPDLQRLSQFLLRP